MDQYDKQISIHDEESKSDEEEPKLSKFDHLVTSVKNNIKDPIFHRHAREGELTCVDDHPTYKAEYQIAICQDGKFAVTFDTANLRIKILKNTDHRPFGKKKKEDTSNEPDDEIKEAIAYFKINDDLTIGNYLSIEKDTNNGSSAAILQENDTKDSQFKWSLDISNIQKRDDVKCIFVAVSRIDVEEDMKGDEVKGKKDSTTEIANDIIIEVINDDTHQKTKGTAIYCLKLNKEEKGNYESSYYSYSVSGICRWINEENEDSIVKDEDLYALSRFIVLNIHGIYNYEVNDFNWNEKFDYPKSFKDELNYCYNEKDCMDKLLSCLYNQYFLVEQYKNNVQALEVFDLATMELKISAKRVEREDKHIRKYNKTAFSISKLQLCFTRGIYSIKLYLMENGLETMAKCFEKIDEICSLEFIDSEEKLLIIGKGPGLDKPEEKLIPIYEDQEKKLNDEKEPIFIAEDQKETETLSLIIWELYRSEEPIVLNNFLTIKNLRSLARTSGNLLQVDDNGKVTSVLKKVENQNQTDKPSDLELKQNQTDEPSDLKLKQNQTDEPSDLKLYQNPYIKLADEKHKLYFDESKNPNFKSIVNDKEPWIMENHERHSYCLYHDKKEGTGTLQLIVGRSTVQIWHRIHSVPDNKNNVLPNKGVPFLEYIWANGIPINQEREETRLRIEEMKYGTNDFFLKVYWYERVSDSEINKIKEKIKGNEKNEKELMKKVMKKAIESEDKIIMQMENEKKETDKIGEMEKQIKVEGNEIMKRKEKTIQWKYISEKVEAIKHAGHALKHFNKRRNLLGNNYIKIHKYEEIVNYVQHIIWRFANLKPVQYRLLDVRYNTMKNLILGDCHHLIKFILFGDEDIEDKNCCDCNKVKEKEEIIRHIPRNISLSGKKFISDDDFVYLNRKKLKDDDEINPTRPKNNMELAIYHCKGRELKDTIIVAYLLEYYSKHATDDAGWMCTVSSALPLLFKYKYDDYARKLFRKECFADQDYFSAEDPYEIIPENYIIRINYDLNFLAFSPNDKLKPNKHDRYDWIFKLGKKIYKSYESFKFKAYEAIKDIDEELGRPPLALRIVPLPGFTKHRIRRDIVEYNLKRIILNVLLFIFIPRWYEIHHDEKRLLSPFSRVIRYENNDDIYDNPATEAVINFRWQEARNYFSLLFLRFLIFALCFVSVSWAYLEHEVLSEGIRNLLIASIVIFYYLAIYLLIIELMQFIYQGYRIYLNIYNIFDVTSIVLPVVVMSMMLSNFQFSDGFGSVTANGGLIVGISFSIFFLWIEAILQLRLVSYIATYIYYFVIIFETIFPYLLFFVVVIIAFANTMYILLKNPEIIIKRNTLSGVATNALTTDRLNITLQSEFNPTDQNDNPFSFMPTAIIAAYYWLNGNMVQRDNFDFWAVDALTLIASIFLVTILQNMLIAFMSGVYTNAETRGRQSLLRYRARRIADYEALHHIHLWPQDPQPKYIYYVGQSKRFEDWYKIIKQDQNAIYKDFEEKSTYVKYNFGKTDYDEYSIWDYKEVKKVEDSK